jgi:putative protease
MEEKKAIGKITHFFSKISVAVVELSGEVSVGDEISIEGPSTNVRQKIDSMQIEHKNIDKAVKGQSIGLKVMDKVREGDTVYKIVQ